MAKSRFNEFYDSIIYERRNPELSKKIFCDLYHKEDNLEEELDTSTVLYRARIVKNVNDLCNIDPFLGYSAIDSMTPPREKTFAQRANYQCIPYLYCSSSIMTAINEVKADKNDIVSVAVIQPVEDIQLIDFSGQRNNILKGTKKTLFNDLSKWFSSPTNKNTNPIEYIPTQYISEFIRYELNYDGIKYKSLNNEGYNYVLYSNDKCKCVSSKIYMFKGTWSATCSGVNMQKESV